MSDIRYRGDGMNEQETLDDAAGTVAVHGPVRCVDNAVDTRFVELLCADADLLRLEFDAIIAANFPPTGTGQQHPSPPPRQPIPATGRLRPEGNRRPAPAVTGSPRRGRRVPEARERSPPSPDLRTSRLIAAA
jgi:hypothetical protein